MKKANWLKNSIATSNGFYSKSGEKLKGKNLTQAECDAWNGVKNIKEAAANKDGIMTKIKMMFKR